MRTKLLGSLSLALLGGLVPSSASADQPLAVAAGADTKAAAVAYNSNADQYFVVYETTYGRLEGQLLDADGTVLENIAAVLPHSLGTTYREPRLTYRPADDQYVLVSIFESSGLIRLREVTVTAFDGEGTLLWTYDVPRPNDVTATTPDVMADAYGDCCTLVTWKQGAGSIVGQRYDATGATQGPLIDIFRDSGINQPTAYNPRIAYQNSPNDDFAVVYQVGRNGNPGLLQARTVQPTSGVLGPVQTLATMVAAPWPRAGQTFPGGPDIAYDEIGQVYYVAWRDADGIWLSRVGPTLVAGRPQRIFTDSAHLNYWAQPGIPEVTVATGLGKAYVSHPLRLDWAGATDYFVGGWWYSATGTFGESSLSTEWSEQSADNVVAGYSPVTREVFGVWERDEISDRWPPPNDLYFEHERAP